MANWNVAIRFLQELQHRALGRRHLACTPENLSDWYSEAFPTESGRQDMRVLIRRLLDTLADAKAIELPKHEDGWLPFPPPKLPVWIRLSGEARHIKDDRHKIYPWGQELSFVADLPSVPHLDVVIAINSWLRDGGREITLRVPLRERSIEITGDEKALDAVIRCQSLQPDPGMGITLDLLKAMLAPPPLAYNRGPEKTAGKPVLVIENAHTWHSIANWNSTACCYAAVIYGNGKSFIGSVPHLHYVISETKAAHEVRYFGDLDYTGLIIPIEAGEVACESGLPIPLPEEWLYRKLVRFPSQLNRGKTGSTDAAIMAVLAWLPEDLRDSAKAIFSKGHRIAQEYIGIEFLSGQNGARS
jgi:hypothetical protein